MPESHDGKKPISAGTAFVRDMQALINDLEKCEPHYIRTIKPNDQKRSGMYDVDLVTHQVRYLGTVENVRVRRAGFAFRSDYTYFVKHFKMLSSATWPRNSGDDRRDTEAILRDIGVPSSEYEMGRSKVFIKKPKFVFQLEEARERILHKVVGIVQKAYRAFKARLYFLRLREESAMLLHHKKRRRGSWCLYFIGDYIRAQENPAITAHLDGRVKFADNVVMLGPKNKLLNVIFVMTSSSLYVISPPKMEVTMHIPFQLIRQFGLSTFADGYMVIDYQSEKPAPTLIFESMRKAEITTVLKEEYGQNQRRELPLVFQDEFQIMVKKKTLFGSKIVPKTLRFAESNFIQGANTKLAATKADNPEFKTVLRIDVGPDLGSRAPYQLDSSLPDRLRRFKGRPGQKKKIVYGGYRQKNAGGNGRRR